MSNITYQLSEEHFSPLTLRCNMMPEWGPTTQTAWWWWSFQNLLVCLRHISVESKLLHSINKIYSAAKMNTQSNRRNLGASFEHVFLKQGKPRPHVVTWLRPREGASSAKWDILRKWFQDREQQRFGGWGALKKITVIHRNNDGREDFEPGETF